MKPGGGPQSPPGCRNQNEGKAVLKVLGCVALVLLLTGCVPIGVRVQNMYAGNAVPQSR
jgi:hypothetical protein